MANYFKPDANGFAELRKSAEVATVIGKAAKQTKGRAESMGCSTSITIKVSGTSDGRVWANIFPTDTKDRMKNLRTNALKKALDNTKI